MDAWLRHQSSIIIFLAVMLLIALSNLRAWRRLGSYRAVSTFPRLSVLVPARNEEVSVEKCVRSLLAQDYPDYEVLVLDDQSDDRTPSVLADLASAERRLQILRGEPPPPPWLGKHWACHQLARAAGSDYLVFVDADTRLAPQTLRYAISATLAEGTDLLSVFPRQEVGSWSERLVVPVLQWSIFCFLPLALAYRLRVPGLVAASGQFMLFRREAYDAIGGHAAVRQDVLDDVALTRRVQANGLRWRLLDGGEHMRCRMYRDFHGVCEGFSKNLFALFGYNVPLFVFVWLWVLTLHYEPLIVLALRLLPGVVTQTNAVLASIAVVEMLCLWGLTSWHFGFPRYLALLYPLGSLLTVGIAMRSLVVTLLGRGQWKGRRLTNLRRG